MLRWRRNSPSATRAPTSSSNPPALPKVEWKKLAPDARNTWLTEGQQEDFEALIPIGSKESKGEETTRSVFRLYSLGIVTSRDNWVVNSSPNEILRNLGRTESAFRVEQLRFLKQTGEEQLGFVPAVSERDIKWTDRLIDALVGGVSLQINDRSIRKYLYRPFNSQYVYFDSLLNQRRYQQHHIFPTISSEAENLSIIVKNSGEWPFFVLAASTLADYQPQGGSQGFPFYTYGEDGTHRRENITDCSLAEFRTLYGQQSISK